MNSSWPRLSFAVVWEAKNVSHPAFKATAKIDYEYHLNFSHFLITKLKFAAMWITEQEADAPHGQRPQCTAACGSSTTLGREDAELRGSSDLNERARAELLDSPAARLSIHANCLIDTHNTQPAGKHSITAEWPLYQTKLCQVSLLKLVISLQGFGFRLNNNQPDSHPNFEWMLTVPRLESRWFRWLRDQISQDQSVHMCE